MDRARIRIGLGPIASIVLLGCGGGEEGDELHAASVPSEALERQIEQGEAFVLELENIDDESDAETAFPRLVSIAAAIYRATPPRHPGTPVGTSEQIVRLEALQGRLIDELIRIAEDDPKAVEIVGDALVAALIAPLD
jgi:hypothetical protein